MREKRPLAFGVFWFLVLVFVWCFLFGFGVACVLFPHHVVFPSPSMMTWTLRPHGVCTRGKKMVDLRINEGDQFLLYLRNLPEKGS